MTVFSTNRPVRPTNFAIPRTNTMHQGWIRYTIADNCRKLRRSPWFASRSKENRNTIKNG